MTSTRTLVLASGNAGKLRELSALLDPLGWTLRPQSEFGVGEADEPHATFVENALTKARWTARHTGLPALADDSGIVVPALGGEPGVRSARYALEEGGALNDAPARPDDQANNAKLLARLADRDDRTALFICVLALVRHADDPLPLLAQGEWVGRVLHATRGAGGFGYDSLFQPAGSAVSAAEMSAADKNAISHRARAMQSLRDQLAASAWSL